MKKEHDIRIDRTKLHPWLNYKLTLLLKQCAKKALLLRRDLEARQSRTLCMLREEPRKETL